MLETQVLLPLRDPCTCTKGQECPACLLWRRQQDTALVDVPDDELADDATVFAARARALEKTIATKQAKIRRWQDNVKRLPLLLSELQRLHRGIATQRTQQHQYVTLLATNPESLVYRTHCVALQKSLDTAQKKAEDLTREIALLQVMQQLLDGWLVEVTADLRLVKQYHTLAGER